MNQLFLAISLWLYSALCLPITVQLLNYFLEFSWIYCGLYIGVKLLCLRGNEGLGFPILSSSDSDSVFIYTSYNIANEEGKKIG